MIFTAQPWRGASISHVLSAILPREFRPQFVARHCVENGGDSLFTLCSQRSDSGDAEVGGTGVLGSRTQAAPGP